MDESRLTRQVMNSRAVRTVNTIIRKGSTTTTRSAYQNALIRGGVVTKEKNGNLTDTWTRRLCNPEIGETIELNQTEEPETLI